MGDAAAITRADAARELLARRAARTSMASYINYCEMGLQLATHHRLLVEALEAVAAGYCDKLMVCMPPGSAKSTYSSVIFPAWALGREPGKNVIAASHTMELAERFGRRVRNLVMSPQHRTVFGSTIAQDSQAAGRWETDRGGEYYATGVGGSVTGRRGDLLIIDDPVRSREDADSERVRQKTWDWYQTDILTRLKPGAAQVVVMTRWHEDDLGGRILERERGEWRVIELAMEALPGDPLGRRPGDRLWPEWFTSEMVRTAKLDVRGWNALYQQQPAAEDGEYFKSGWLHDYDIAGDLADLAIYGASDYAVTADGGDYTEHGVFGVDRVGNVLVLDWWRAQASSDVWIEKQCELIGKYKPLCWFGETGPIRKAIEPYLLRRMRERNAWCRIEWLPLIHDKPTRARAFQALASMGRVFWPKHTTWKADVLGQLLKFPVGKHDDAVDVVSLFGRGLEMVAPTANPGVKFPDPRRRIKGLVA